ncbi:MAG TPA: cation transporter [Hanamia sp.]
MSEVDEDIMTKKKTFPVTGMSCASCAVSVETMLQAEPGVVKAGVNYANSSASVEYDPEVADINHFKQAIQSIGYDLIIEDNESSSEELEKKSKAIIKHFVKEPFFLLYFLFPSS